MELDMEMDVDDADAELVFEAREIDLDYEFDAAMFFDLTREESHAEAREAERWFERAQSYPPSPFVAKLVLREGSLLEDVATSPNSRDVDDTATFRSDDCSVGLGPEAPAVEVDNKGLSYYNHASSDTSRIKVKSTFKPNLPRTSTLMKPTASILAKQNQPPQADGSRFQLLPAQKEKSIYKSSAVESQAAKRQKLEGGRSQKVGDAKQQTSFVHKAPKKDGTVDKGSANPKLRLTIPREPDLETAHRAQRIRPKNSTEVETVEVASRRFRARPLNRKILEAPSLPLPKKSTPKLPEFQEFRLKTLERAMQHISTVSSSLLQRSDPEKGLDKPGTISVAENGKRESRRPSAMDSQELDESSTAHVFKARPLDKKIFTSKGDIGVFRNSKREATVPMEFNFHTEKRIQHNPPIDLFSKLSLTSELQPNNGSQLQLPRPSCISLKGSKENRLNPLQTEHKMAHLAIGKPPIFGGKQAQCNEVGNQLSVRSLGVR
ncbi:protein TPX2 isoform X2 [Manihot esculenta]|uniref:protein TPX2 isoform X2 n=1 Tax=Manihot esculenta TaxID=3983 RepID=UPI001CC655FE|nr:protein TPX2 isoform X2 [Manihot esculenta]